MKSFFEMVEDFGNMSTGAFIAKYPDCGHYEGYGYVQRKAREARRKASPQPVDETEMLRSRVAKATAILEQGRDGSAGYRQARIIAALSALTDTKGDRPMGDR